MTLSYLRERLVLLQSLLHSSSLRIGSAHDELAHYFIEENKIESALYHLSESVSILEHHLEPEDPTLIREILKMSEVFLCSENPEKELAIKLVFLLDRSIVGEEGSHELRGRLETQVIKVKHVLNMNFGSLK